MWNEGFHYRQENLRQAARRKLHLQLQRKAASTPLAIQKWSRADTITQGGGVGEAGRAWIAVSGDGEGKEDLEGIHKANHNSRQGRGGWQGEGQMIPFRLFTREMGSGGRLEEYIQRGVTASAPPKGRATEK